jgi:hypothetical protein
MLVILACCWAEFITSLHCGLAFACVSSDVINVQTGRTAIRVSFKLYNGKGAILAFLLCFHNVLGMKYSVCKCIADIGAWSPAEVLYLGRETWLSVIASTTKSTRYFVFA